jgi:hypothetical protein
MFFNTHGGLEKGKKVVVILLIAIIFVIVGCSEKAPPLPKVVSGTIKIPVVQSSYSWGNVSADYVGGEYMVKGKIPTILPSGTNIKISFDYKPQPSLLRITQFISRKTFEVKFKDGIIKVPINKGVYYYEIEAYWTTDDGKYSNGNTSSLFVIEVK